jgi:beta-N-acetylhexosaminidase
MKNTPVSIFTALLLAVTSSSAVFSQKSQIPWADYLNAPSIDSILNTLSVKEMVAQSFWVPAWDLNGNINYSEVEKLVVENGLGGVIFAEGIASKQAGFAHRLDSLSRIPLIIAQDAEWGTGMRLTGVESFPFQMTLGAIQNDSLIYFMGAAVAAECRAVGVDVDLAPVADVNNNPLNPVINYRSFGEEANSVARKAAMYMKGLQDNGVIACAKHFPGHGDTDTDSHLGLPVIKSSRERFDTIEFLPFRFLIDLGIGAVMTAHINVPTLDPTPMLPATFSYPVVTTLLKNEMGFSGLVISDAMSMNGATGAFPSGIADAMAYSAGNDILEYSTDPVKAIDEITRRVDKGEIPIDDVKNKCRKILAVKYWIASKKSDKDRYGITVSNMSPSPKLALIRDMYADAITLIENQNDLIPVKNLDKVRIATVSVNGENLGSFREMAGRYTRVDHFDISTSDMAGAEKTITILKSYDIVLAAISGLSQKPQISFGITPELRNIAGQLASLDKCIISWFGNPFGVDLLGLETPPACFIVAYQDNKYSQEAAVQVIFGAMGASGKLPVTINGKYPIGYGINTPGNLRLQYGYPENAQMSSSLLNSKVDSIVQAGLDSMAYPGCEVLIARKGIVVYNKTFGYQTYEKKTPISSSDLFDLASVTKVSATTPCLIMLEGNGQFDPDRTLGSYLPYFKGSNKDSLRLRDMLAHQAGLVPFIPFYKYTLGSDGTYKKCLYSHHFSNKYNVQVTDSLYLNKNYRKEIFKEIRDSKVGKKKYLYSDLNFILSAEVINSITGETVDMYAPEHIYHRLGAYDITYKPLEKYPYERIVPTENDTYFRHQQLRGTVHDEGAALLGGVAGHAGLFATGNDLLKLVETYRRMGSYGGEQVFSYNVMKEYTSVQFPENDNRRGLCFDKPSLPNDTIAVEDIYPCKSASPSSFGHAGYTGTFVWADPDAEISYVFLSNRVYPTRNNSRISDMNIRTAILQAAIEAIEIKD